MTHLDFRSGEGFPRAQEFTETFHRSSNFAYAYSYAVFLTISGHLLGRRVWMKRRQNLYPNFYTCLVGPSAESRKSTIMSLGLDTIPPETILEGLSTVLGLTSLLDDLGGNLLVHFDEIATFLTQTRKDYARDLITSLTTLYDNPRVIQNNSHKTRIRVENPSLSILAGSTVEWLQTTMSIADLLGGFGNRMTFILGDPRNEYGEPEPATTDFDWEPCFKREGHIGMTPEAYEGMGYYENEFKERIKDYSPVHKVLLQRVTDKVLKAAMIQAVWEDTEVDLEILQQAVNWGHYLEKCVEILAPKFEPLDKQVLALIKQDINTKHLIYKEVSHFQSAKDVDQSVYYLERIGAIEEFMGGYVTT